MAAPTVARRRRRRWGMLAGAFVLAVPVTAAAWLGVQAWQAKDELAAAVPLARDLTAAVAARDTDSAALTLDRLVEHAERARSLTGSPLWEAASLVPGIGPNASAIRTVSAELASVATDALSPLLQVAGAVHGLDPAALDGAREPLQRAATTMNAARDALSAIDASALLPPVADGVTTLRDAVDSTAPAIDGVARASSVLPTLLGGEGPRTVLVMLQNNAEVRTGGGITGAFVELRADGGGLTLVRQAESADFAPRASAIAPVAASTDALYGDVSGRFVQNATMPADFAVSAALASAWWQSAFGTTPDAVIAIDPFVLRALLEVAGPATLADGSVIGADDVVSKLLVDPYRQLGPQEQTAYLQHIAAGVFAALVERVDPLTWAAALAPVVEEGRVSVWSADPVLQAELASSAVGGPRARAEAAGDDAYAVYLNDATAGKMDGYLEMSVAAGRCGDDDLVRVTLRHTGTADVVGLPPSVTGGGLHGTAVGDIGTNVTVAAPPGAAFGGAQGQDGAEPSADVMDGEHPSTAVRVNVSPGESETVTFRFVRVGGAGGAEILHTPLMAPVEITRIAGCGD